jgi:hypothetical protein
VIGCNPREVEFGEAAWSASAKAAAGMAADIRTRAAANAGTNRISREFIVRSA